MRVLVVEDEPEILAAAAQSLREAGYAVDEADNGIDGLFKAQNWDYDAIVLDLMLPGLDGWKLLSQLRKTKCVPVLILSARDTVEDRIDGLDLGADDYLVKPFALGELHARLRSLIRRSAGHAEGRIAVAGAVVDLKARCVSLDGRPVELTAREFAIVELLAIHRDKVVTRTQMYDHIFDENDDTLSNLLDVHISNIRKKLGRDFIKTRRGHGYVLEDGPDRS